MFKIGEFSRLCGITVPTLRYYDTLDLIKPTYTDNFTGYRYYDFNNLKEIHKLIALKDAGFSLDEIKCIMKDKIDLITIINERQSELTTQSERIALQLELLAEVKIKLESEEKNMANVIINNNNSIEIVSVRKIISDRTEIESVRQELETKHSISGTLIVINYETDFSHTEIDCEIGIETNGSHKNKTIPAFESTAAVICEADKLSDGYMELNSYIKTYEYQIIGAFYEKYYGNLIELKVPVTKLTERQSEPHNDDIDILFKDDPDIIGKWQYVDTVPTSEHFNPLKVKNKGWKAFDILHFLPNGEQYWCYRWTKNHIIYQSGMNERSLNRYYFKEMDGQRYMFIEMKGGTYRFYSGEPEIYVLKQLDNKAYDKSEARIFDDTNIPFVTDKTVLGKWRVCNFIESLEIANDIDLDHYKYENNFLFWRSIEFFDSGLCKNVFKNGNKESAWTAGYILNHHEKTTESYVIKRKNGCDYLIVQWKNGDYIYARREPHYYVFRRDE